MRLQLGIDLSLCKSSSENFHWIGPLFQMYPWSRVLFPTLQGENDWGSASSAEERRYIPHWRMYHRSSISVEVLAYLLQFLKNVQIPSTMFVQASLCISCFLYSISQTSITLLFYSIFWGKPCPYSEIIDFLSQPLMSQWLVKCPQSLNLLHRQATAL